MRTIDKANYKGVYWKDIDWTKPIHDMPICTCCGVDAGEMIGMGHQSCCYYGTGSEHRMALPFFESEIKEALRREGRLDENENPIIA